MLTLLHPGYGDTFFMLTVIVEFPLILYHRHRQNEDASQSFQVSGQGSKSYYWD